MHLCLDLGVSLASASQGRITARNLNYLYDQSSYSACHNFEILMCRLQVSPSDSSTLPECELISTWKCIASLPGNHLAAWSFPSSHEDDSALAIHVPVSALLLLSPLPSAAKHLSAFVLSSAQSAIPSKGSRSMIT